MKDLFAGVAVDPRMWCAARWRNASLRPGAVALNRLKQVSNRHSGTGKMSTLDRETERNSVWPAERDCQVGTIEIARVAQEKCAKLARAKLVAVNLVQADI